MLSNMESPPTAREAAAALADAEAARAALAGAIATPSWLFVSIAAAVAAHIAATAVGLAEDAPLAVAAGLALFAAVAAVQLARFRRHNGVWLGGFASRVVLGTTTPAAVGEAVALAAAIWAAFAAQWWLVALCASAGGIVYAVGGRRWIDAYRAQPATGGRGESAALLALFGVAALVGLVLLLIAA
jgi:hypothetical protein